MALLTYTVEIDGTATPIPTKWSLWTNMKNDLTATYFKEWTYFTDEDPDNLASAQNLHANDTWREIYTVPGYYQGSTQLSGVAPGYIPTFNHWKHTVSSGSSLTLRRYNWDRLDVGSQQFAGSTFKDGVAPYCLGVIVQGAGGGGGGTYGTGDGTGGGAGGCVVGVLKLGGTASMTIGTGGAGGYKKEVNSSVEGGAAAGGSTYIYLGGYAFQANGGGAGRNSTKSNSYAAGSGGTASSTGNYAFHAKTFTGGRGGKVYSLSNATGVASDSAWLTANTSITTTAFKKLFSATSGGAQGDGNAPGGGGGSREYSGPAGGGFAADGKAGSAGCGGSGGRYTIAVYKRGGAGGNGYITLFY